VGVAVLTQLTQRLLHQLEHQLDHRLAELHWLVEFKLEQRDRELAVVMETRQQPMNYEEELVGEVAALAIF
jgi:hypothetical protein